MLPCLLILLGIIGLCIGCPSSCVCKWKGGKQTVECINKSLITIPDGIDAGTQVLDFAGNNLKVLPRERFQRMGLINLQKIYLSRCRISHIEDRAFRGLTNLVELDLSDNQITNIPTESFFDYTSLMRLTLNGNPIRLLKTASFQPLSFLTSLELSNCQMETIDDDAFAGLTNLEWLKLDNNRLVNMRGSHILPESLHGIDLHHNPWACDCRLLDLRSWLLKYNVPHSIEPKCSSPARLRGSLVRAADENELACLPDVTPTTLYLEISEGKNVSLLCRVSAIPEAKVSWWFQGNILQNDSMIAPGLHLFYYLEEGTVEKKSELFIFNTNVDDNGTFVCVAENPAGRTQSNYTIRIVLKEEPLVGLAVFPYEYVIVVSATVSVVALLLAVTVALCVVRCRRKRRRRRKKDRSKVVALQNHQHLGKAPGVRSSSEHITRLPQCQAKANGSLLAEPAREILVYNTGTGVLVVPNSMGPDPAYGCPTSLPNYQLEQNPDLINDTESVAKERRLKRETGEEETELSGNNSYQEAMDNVIDEYESKRVGGQWSGSNMAMLPRMISGSRELQQKQHMTADIHLSPGKFICNDGYPADYGLPKLPTHFPVMMPGASFYRTLPHKPRQTAANPGSRYSREAEFLSKSAQPASYEHYSPGDVRYTVEGYPCAQPGSAMLLPSPPAAYKGDSPGSPRDASAQWPETSPDSLPPRAVCNAAAQTNDCDHKINPLRLPPPCALVLTESPDEGYEGETGDSMEI